MNDLESLTKGDLYRQTIEFIRSYAIDPQKKLGQHFVLDPLLIKTLLETAQLSEEDTVLEIGGGLGTLSQFIAPLVKNLTVIEIDPLLTLILNREVASQFGNVRIIHGDAVTCDLPQFNVVIGNLPYQISTPLSLRLGRLQNPDFRGLIATYQAEYASRIAAQPKTQNYGRITAALSYFFDFNIIKTYPPRTFYPSPKVAASVVFGIPLEAPPETLLPEFETFLTILFNRKNRRVRKVLRLAVKKGAPIGQSELKKLDEHDLSTERVVNLSKEQLLELFRLLFIT
ncbi:MAG: 16S rRNA (adenine(1518)-N(6)/adenine(1519)-N(6))-dimethyltransferase RsmA [Candidatus Hodarchaeota archaeon]